MSFCKKFYSFLKLKIFKLISRNSRDIKKNNQLESVPTNFLAEKLLSGKTALITGAGQNIGRSTALEMALQGADIIAIDKNELTCRKLVEEINALGVSCYPFVIDITQAESIETLLSDLDRISKKIDILVNNVGITPKSPRLTDLSQEHFRNLFEINVFSPLDITYKIANSFIRDKRSGVILFITSIHDSVPSRLMAYSSSKSALSTLVKELAIELSGYGIRVNAIAPGWVTENEVGEVKSHIYTFLHQSSINPRYIGRAAVYLASDYFSRFTTGITLTIDGGLSLYSARTHQVPPPRSP